MTTIGRQITRSFVCQLLQPRWNQLLLKKLHFVAINQQRRFSKDSDYNDEEKKECIDYRKNPCIEGHVARPFPPKQHATPQSKIKRKRECKQRKKCKKMAEKEAKKCNDDSSASFTGARGSMFLQKVNSFLWYLSQLNVPVLGQVYLNQVRKFCKPVSKRQRIVRKRKYLLAKKIKAEAEAKAKAKSQNQNLDKAFAQLKKACIENSQTGERMQEQFKDAFEDLKIRKDQGEERPTDNLIKSMITRFMKECAHSQKTNIHAEKEGRKAQNEDDLNRLRQAIKEKCRKKREEFQKYKKAESKKKAENAALKNVSKVAQLQKLCEEAKKNHLNNIAKIHKLYEEAKLKRQSLESASKIEFWEMKRDTAAISKKQDTDNE